MDDIRRAKYIIAQINSNSRKITDKSHVSKANNGIELRSKLKPFESKVKKVMNSAVSKNNSNGRAIKNITRSASLNK